MDDLKGKKILFLGGSNYFYDAAIYAKACGVYLIVIDYRSSKHAITKRLADEEYLMSTTDIEEVYLLAKKKKVDGIYAGASEVNIPVAMEVCKRLGLPYYSTPKQWELSTNKGIFKEECINYGIPVTPVYNLTEELREKELENLVFPVVTKPVDNNGSTGISICHNSEELKKGYKKAMDSSKSKNILIEKYIPSNSVIIHYTLVEGEVLFSGISDKKSKKIIDDGAPVMSLQTFPSLHTRQYLDELNDRVCMMLNGLNMKNGSIWIEAFYHDNNFIFNEIAYRYGGSLTYYPVEYYYGINQMHLLIYHSLTGKSLYGKSLREKYRLKNEKKRYYIIPIQIKSGKIKEIKGVEEIKKLGNVVTFVQAHTVGNVIEETGTTLQVFAYLHIIAEDSNDIKRTMSEVNNLLKVTGDDEKNKVFTLVDIDEIS